MKRGLFRWIRAAPCKCYSTDWLQQRSRGPRSPAPQQSHQRLTRRNASTFASGSETRQKPSQPVARDTRSRIAGLHKIQVLLLYYFWQYLTKTDLVIKVTSELCCKNKPRWRQSYSSFWLLSYGVPIQSVRNTSTFVHSWLASHSNYARIENEWIFGSFQLELDKG